MGIGFTNPFRYSEVNEYNELRPPTSTVMFERQLEQISRDFNVPLRLVWCCDRDRREMVGYQGNQMGYLGKIYAQNPPRTDCEHVGWNVCSNAAKGTVASPDKVLYYARVHALPYHLRSADCAFEFHHDPRTDLWWCPDWKETQIAYARYQIETRDNDTQREDYEAKSFNPNNLELVQELGPWPAEGLWIPPCPMIAEHNYLCCEEANETFSLCPGRYRPPDARDLEGIRAGLRKREADGKWRGVNQDNFELAEAVYKQMMEREKERVAKIQAMYEEIIGNAIAPIANAWNPMVIGGVNKPRHTVNMTERDLRQLTEEIPL
jgi:hypothetical protein